MNQNKRSNRIDYSVVVPVYNAEETLVSLFEGIISAFESLRKSVEVIFVDDGSKDQSWKVLTYLKNDYPDKVKAIRLAKNYGQHNAIFCGLSFVKESDVITIDDDLQTPPEEIIKLIKKHEETNADLVYGYYKRKKHNLWRNLGSKFLKKTSKTLYNAPGEGSSFKLIENKLVKDILNHYQNFVYIDELFLWYTEDIAFVEVRHISRKGGGSGYTAGKLLRLFFNITIYYTAVPLKLMTATGLIASLISFGFGIRFIIRKIFFDVPLGYTSMIVTILFSTSLILLSLGIIGEYLNRIYLVQNKKPPYSIKKVLK
ncbi:MAG: glycosyltransferase family 2 protein [Bacteroidota bacterium]